MDQIHEVALAIYAEVPRTAIMPVKIIGGTDGRFSNGAVMAPVSWGDLTSEMQRPYRLAARKAIEASTAVVHEALALYGEACSAYGRSPSFATTLAMSQAFDAVIGPAVAEASARQIACSRMGIMDPDGGRTLPDDLLRPATAPSDPECYLSKVEALISEYLGKPDISRETQSLLEDLFIDVEKLGNSLP